MIAYSSKPRLAPNVRLRFDLAGNRLLLLDARSALELDATGADVVRLCTGRHTVRAIIGAITGTQRGRKWDGTAEEVIGRLRRLADAALVLTSPGRRLIPG